MKIKKYFSVLILFMISLGLTSCGNNITSLDVVSATVDIDYYVDDFDINNIKLLVRYSDGSYEEIPALPEYLSTTDYQKLSGIGVHEVTFTYKGKSTVSFITIVERVTEIDTRYADNLKMDFNYEGSEFIKNGIGLVKINRVIDGDTISVTTPGNVGAITIRFLGINTPESTGTIEAWGKAAKTYAKDVLSKAQSVVLEAEGERKDSNGTRWLAWVWYIPENGTEYRLFNLEEVEMAYTKYIQNVESKYHDVMKKANDKTKQTGVRVWGELDPNFSYSKEVIETNLLNLWYNHDSYQEAQYFKVTVRLVRTVGNNMYLEDAEEQEIEINDGESFIVGKGGFYAFYGYSFDFYRTYNIGDVFTLECQVQWEGDYGNQLTGLRKSSVVNKTLSGEPDITIIQADDIRYEMQNIKDDNGNPVDVLTSQLYKYYGKVITVENLKCIGVNYKNTGTSDYYTVVFENSYGEKIDLYVNNNTTITDWRVDIIFKVGSYYNITGGISFYHYCNGYYQITLGDAPRYSGGIINEKDILRINDVLELE